MIECLIAAMFFEARDQSIAGKEAVAEVVMNRVLHRDFPDKVCEVVYEADQFSFTNDGLSDNPRDYPALFDKKKYTLIKKIAAEYLDGREPEIASTHFHAVYVKPPWSDVYALDGKIGDHVFYTCDSKKMNC